MKVKRHHREYFSSLKSAASAYEIMTHAANDNINTGIARFGATYTALGFPHHDDESLYFEDKTYVISRDALYLSKPHRHLTHLFSCRGAPFIWRSGRYRPVYVLMDAFVK